MSPSDTYVGLATHTCSENIVGLELSMAMDVSARGPFWRTKGVTFGVTCPTALEAIAITAHTKADLVPLLLVTLQGPEPQALWLRWYLIRFSFGAF